MKNVMPNLASAYAKDCSQRFQIIEPIRKISLQMVNVINEKEIASFFNFFGTYIRFVDNF